MQDHQLNLPSVPRRRARQRGWGTSSELGSSDPSVENANISVSDPDHLDADPKNWDILYEITNS